MFKMKNVIKILIASLAFVTAASAEMKIGYINSDAILMQYEGTKSAEAALEKEYAKWEQQATEKQKEMKEIQDELSKQALLISAERKAELEKKLQELYIEYQKFLQEKFGQQGQAAKRNEELLRPIITKINTILDKIAKDENYDFIFDTKMGVVFAKKQYDLTDKVLKALNAGSSK